MEELLTHDEHFEDKGRQADIWEKFHMHEFNKEGLTINERRKNKSYPCNRLWRPIG
jgi:hypothetical protein